MIRAALMLSLVAASAIAQENRTAAAPTSVPGLQLTTAVSSQPDLCIGVETLAVGTVAVGATLNRVKVDGVCTRIRRAKALQGLGYPLAAAQLLCADPEVHDAMRRAGTPCEDQRAK